MSELEVERMSDSWEHPSQGKFRNKRSASNNENIKLEVTGRQNQSSQTADERSNLDITMEKKSRWTQTEHFGVAEHGEEVDEIYMDASRYTTLPPGFVEENLRKQYKDLHLKILDCEKRLIELENENQQLKKKNLEVLSLILSCFLLFRRVSTLTNRFVVLIKRACQFFQR